MARRGGAEPLAQQLWQVLPHVLLPKPEAPLERLDAVAYGPGLGNGALKAGCRTSLACCCWMPMGSTAWPPKAMYSLAAAAPRPHLVDAPRGGVQRLFPSSPLPPHQAASQAAQQSQCWVLRKGART